MNLSDLKRMDKDDVLNLLGLETRKSPSDYLVPVLGAFSVGLLVGAGLGLLLAPKPGHELRNDLRARLTPPPNPQPTQASHPEHMARSA